MSKIISFSISDKYLEKLRSLYPSLTDNLAAKQFLTDRLDSSLGSTLDDVLDDSLDDKLKTLIETSLDDVLDERLDAVMGKLLTSLSERLARLEERLDDSLDGRLDDMEPSPFPTIGENVEATIDTVETADKVEAVYTVEIADKVESVDETVEAVTDTVESVTDTVEAVDDTVESATMEPNSSINEPVTGPIDPVPGDSPQMKTQLSEGMNAADAYRYLTSKRVKVSEKTLSDWISKIKHIPMTGKGDAVSEYLILRDGRYYPIN